MARKKSKRLPPLPKGEFEFTSASTFGMDSFNFNQPDNGGVLEGARLPEVKGLSALPGDFFVEPEPSLRSIQVSPGPDISGFLNERRATQVPNLDWLALTEGYESALPEDPSDGMLDEIIEAWGRGEQRVPVPVKEATNRIDSSLMAGSEPSTSSRGYTLTTSELVEKLRAASRDLSRGVPLKVVLAAFDEDRLSQEDAKLLRRGAQQLEDDHGLLGHIFVRASAYPGCESRRWSKDVARLGSDVRYLVTARKCEGCIYNDAGSCQIFGKRLVSEVPWKKALDRLAGRVTAAGIKIAKGEHPRETLRRVFSRMKTYRETRESSHYVQPDPTAGVDFERAYEQLRKNPRTTEIIDVVDHGLQHRVGRAVAKLRQWSKQNLLTDEALDAFTRLAHVDPSKALGMAAEYMWRSEERRGTYEGEGVDAALPRASNQSDARDAKEVQREVDAAVRTKLSERLGSLVKAQVLTAKEVHKLLKLKKSVSATMRLASSLVAKKQLDGDPFVPEEIPVGQYKGEGENAIPNYEEGLSLLEAEASLANAAPKHKVHPREVDRVLRYAAQKMSEGLAGVDLDGILSTKFSSLVLNEAGEKIAALRRRHEGLAGHLYVDASVYASDKGVKGCEEGARTHRGNAIEFLMAMKRCASCKLNSAGFCQKYDKRLTYKIPTENPKAFQAEAIRLANADDAERTASLFSPSGAQLLEKFGGLRNSVLDDISFEGETEPDQLGEILWGTYVDTGDKPRG